MAQANFGVYTIVFSKSAEKFLKTLDKSARQRVITKIKELCTNSENLDIKKLKSRRALYRLRVGRFRVIYTIESERLVIYIVGVGHRKNIYQSSSFA